MFCSKLISSTATALVFFFWWVNCLSIIVSAQNINSPNTHDKTSAHEKHQATTVSHTHHNTNISTLHNRDHQHHQHHPSLGSYKGKIAFMFLSRGEILHEDLWELFFTFHAPRTFYSIYWHTQPGYKPPINSFFHNHQIKNLISTKWADMSLIEATRNMIKDALLDPENKYFVLLSESCIPLLSFPVWYRNMMHYADSYSLINACDFGAKNMETNTRWRAELDTVPGFSRDKFRKSGQWFGLNRKHASLAANDTILASKFGVVVPSDEHYMASLLALHGLDNETTCSDGYAHVYWQDLRASHPTSYSSESLNNFNPPPSAMFAHDKLIALIESPNDADIVNKRKELMSTWREYDKHKNIFAHLRNTYTTFDIFNGRCAFFALTEDQQTIPLPPGAVAATSWPIANSQDISTAYIQHVNLSTVANSALEFAHFLVVRNLLPMSLLSTEMQSKIGKVSSSGNHSHLSSASSSSAVSLSSPYLSETLPCHFSGRKFPATTRLQLLSMAHTLFRDDAFQLYLTQQEVLNRTVFRHLRYTMSPTSDSGIQIYLIEQHRLVRVPDVRYLLYPIPPHISADPSTMNKYLSQNIRRLTPEEEELYGGIASASSMVFLPEGTAVKYPRDNTVYLIVNFTRRVIPDFDTFLKLGLSTGQIRTVGPNDVQHILLGPMLPSLSTRRSRMRSRRITEQQIAETSASSPSAFSFSRSILQMGTDFNDFFNDSWINYIETNNRLLSFLFSMYSDLLLSLMRWGWW